MKLHFAQIREFKQFNFGRRELSGPFAIQNSLNQLALKIEFAFQLD